MISISKEVFNEPYLPYLDNDDRILCIYGGSGSGKSYFIVQRYLYRLLKDGRRVLLVVRKTGRSNRDSTFALFRQVISQWGLAQMFDINTSDMRITCKNGAEILFSGLDDVEKLKSTTGSRYPLSDIWIEEASEILDTDFKQLQVRLRGGQIKHQIVLSFNPIDITHWIKKDLIDTGVATVLHTTYKDNKFLDPEYKEILEGYKDTDPYYYAVYCLGEWGVYGSTIFDKEQIARRLAELPPYRQGTMIDGAFHEETNGDVKIYEEPKPYRPYVIGADTSGDGSDYFAAHIIDNTNGRQVAVLHSQYDEDIFAKEIIALGRWYNNALVGIESNFSTYPIRELERLGYYHQYVRERMDSATHRPTKAYGFRTTSTTRPVIISNLVKIVRESIDLINDRETLQEMLTFVRNEKGRPEAMQGSHDDLVMSLAITYQIREQQSYQEFTRPSVEPTYHFESLKPQIDPLGSGEEIYVI